MDFENAERVIPNDKEPFSTIAQFKKVWQNPFFANKDVTRHLISRSWHQFPFTVVTFLNLISGRLHIYSSPWILINSRERHTEKRTKEGDRDVGALRQDHSLEKYQRNKTGAKSHRRIYLSFFPLPQTVEKVKKIKKVTYIGRRITTYRCSGRQAGGRAGTTKWQTVGEK